MNDEFDEKVTKRPAPCGEVQRHIGERSLSRARVRRSAAIGIRCRGGCAFLH
ncbi:MAG: hypothetical protein AB7E40_02885 [Pseudomonas sp.]